MSGIQALERKAPTKPMKHGLIERVKHEYTQRQLKLRFFSATAPGMPYPHTWLKAQFLAMRSIYSSRDVELDCQL